MLNPANFKVEDIQCCNIHYPRILDGQDRSQRCLPYSGSTGRISEISPFYLERGSLPIQSNTTWAKHSPVHIHKIAEKAPHLTQNPWIPRGHASSCPQQILLIEQVNMTISLLQALCFRVNWDKLLITPQQTLEFLGIE